MTHPILYGKGLTWIKTDSSTWKPVANVWQKTDNSTWTPITRANLKVNSNTWESVYPTPRGINTPSPTSLTFNPYQHHTDPLSDNQVAPAQNIKITNTGDYDLVVTNVLINDSTGNYQTVDAGYGFITPVTIPPNQSTNFTLKVLGQTVGTGFTGNVIFQNDIGFLGSSNVVVPVTVNVLADYNGIQTNTSLNLTTYVLDSPLSVSLPITNTGNGANLNISNITSQNGYVTISSVPSVIGYNFNTFTGNTASATVTTANLNVGTYYDTITINSNATGIPVLKIPVTVNVLQPNGLQAFTAGGTYHWTVPAHVHRLDITGVGAGGGGGTAAANGQNYVYGGYVLQGGGGGGGGSGAYSINKGIAVTPGETLTITVGAGGTGGTNTNSQFYPVSLNYAWSSFMNSYAVWTNVDGVTPVNTYVTSRRLFTAPYSGNYNVLISADNGVSVYIDGNLIGSSSDYTSTSTYTTSMSQANHVITFVAINTGGPAGFAVVIEDTGNNVLWSTRTDLTNWSGGLGADTTITGSFGTITVAGGGAGGGAIDDGYVYSGDGGGGGSGDGTD